MNLLGTFFSDKETPTQSNGGVNGTISYMYSWKLIFWTGLHKGDQCVNAKLIHNNREHSFGKKSAETKIPCNDWKMWKLS